MQRRQSVLRLSQSQSLACLVMVYRIFRVKFSRRKRKNWKINLRDFCKEKLRGSLEQLVMSRKCSSKDSRWVSLLEGYSVDWWEHTMRSFIVSLCTFRCQLLVQAAALVSLWELEWSWDLKWKAPIVLLNHPLIIAYYRSTLSLGKQAKTTSISVISFLLFD